MNIPKIVICGKSASGKDYLKNKFMKNSWCNYAAPYTTRPRRNGEIDGVDYNFISKDEFKDMISHGLFACWNCYNDWYYGITDSQFNASNLFIMTPEYIAQLSKTNRSMCHIIYVDAPYNVRYDRLVNRNHENDDNEWSDRIERRMEADERQFKDFTDYDIRIKDFD